MNRSLCALAARLVFAPAVPAQTALELGTAIPLADEPFTTTGSATLSLGAAAGAQGLAVVLWSDSCPWVSKYAARLDALVDQYGRAGVGFVFVQSETPSEEADATVTPSGPVVLDAEGRLAAALGAQSVPQAFFFGPDGALAYQGAIDDSPASVDRVRVPYLQQAMDQSLAGVPIEVQSTRALGCTVKAGR